VNCAASVPLAVIPEVAGVIVIEETVSATVAVVVPVMEPEEAVMVVVPADTPASRPPVVTVATVVSELDQQTVLPVQLVPPFKVLLLPSLKVAAAVSCSEAAPLPKPTDGLGGSIVMEETVGFWKKPVQLTARAKAVSAAKAPPRRSLFFVDDIVIRDSLGACLATSSALLVNHCRRAGDVASMQSEYDLRAATVVKNCSRENSGRGRKCTSVRWYGTIAANAVFWIGTPGNPETCGGKWPVLESALAHGTPK